MKVGVRSGISIVARPQYGLSKWCIRAASKVVGLLGNPDSGLVVIASKKRSLDSADDLSCIMYAIIVQNFAAPESRVCILWE